jgi:hypothetical protein
MSGKITIALVPPQKQFTRIVHRAQSGHENLLGKHGEVGGEKIGIDGSNGIMIHFGVRSRT